MNGLVWVFSGVLAVVFLVTGVVKAFSYEQAQKRFTWAKDVRPGLVRFIGLAEILCALGLVLPVATNIYPWLTLVAAAALIILLILAIGFLALRRETDEISLNVLLLIFVAVVAYLRFPLLSRP